MKVPRLPVSTATLLGKLLDEHSTNAEVVELVKSDPSLIASLLSASMGAELLRAWNLPEALCRSIELQHFPEFALPERVPEDVRKNLARLYLANRFHDRVHGDDDHAPSPFAEEYLSVLGVTGVNRAELFHQKVRPALLARIKSLPKSLAEALSA